MKKFKHQLSINFTKIEKRKIINPYTHIKEFGIPWANLQNITRIKINYKKKKKSTSKSKTKKRKIKISMKCPRATFNQPKEAKNPPKMSLLLQTKPSKSISKVPSKFSTKQKSFLPQRLSNKKSNCVLLYVCL